MGNKPQKNKYGSFGYITEAISGKKRRIRRELLAEFSAWLLMMGCTQEKIARTLAARLVKDSIPGMRSTLNYARQSVQCCEWLISVLGQSFRESDWNEAAIVVAESWEIEADTPPILHPPTDAITFDVTPEE